MVKNYIFLTFVFRLDTRFYVFDRFFVRFPLSWLFINKNIDFHCRTRNERIIFIQLKSNKKLTKLDFLIENLIYYRRFYFYFIIYTLHNSAFFNLIKIICTFLIWSCMLVNSTVK